MVKTQRKVFGLLLVAIFSFAFISNFALTVSAGGLISINAWSGPLQTNPASPNDPYCITTSLYSLGKPDQAVDGVLSYDKWRYLDAATKGEKYATFDITRYDLTRNGPNIDVTQYAFYANVPTGYSILSHIHYATSTGLATIDDQQFPGAPGTLGTTFTTDPKEDVVSRGVTFKKYYSSVLSTPINIRYIKFAFEMRNSLNVCDMNPQIPEVFAYNDENIVANAKAALTSDDQIRNANVDLNNVVTNLTLPTFRAGATISWASNNSAVATNGTVTRPASGKPNESGTLTATITANNVTDTQTFQVTVLAQPSPVTGVSLNKETTSIAVGNTETLVATIAPPDAANKNVMWLSSDGNVATVDENGMVTAVATGTADILVSTYDGGYMAICSVTVIPSTTVKYNVTGIVSLLTGADLTEVLVVVKQLDVTVDTVSVLEDGTFAISLEPGMYTLEIVRSGYLKKIFSNFTVTTDASQILSDTPINLIAGDVVTTAQNTIDLQDLQTILTNFSSTSSDLTFQAQYDLNDDGNINLIDLQAVLKNFGSVP